MQVKVLNPAPAGSTLAFSPVPAPLLELAADHLALGLDIGSIDYRSLTLVAAFSEGETQKGARLLLFVEDRRRPFLIDASRIRFSPDFEATPNRAGVDSATAESGLRRAVRSLLSRNPGAALDRPTYDFLCGSPPRTLERDVVALASEIGSALARAASPDSSLRNDSHLGSSHLGSSHLGSSHLGDPPT